MEVKPKKYNDMNPKVMYQAQKMVTDLTKSNPIAGVAVGAAVLAGIYVYDKLSKRNT